MKKLPLIECPHRIVAAWSQKLPVTGGGYAESVDSSWRESSPASRLIVTQARLAYTFCHCSLLDNANTELSRAASESIRRLMSVFWKPELRGWIHSVDAAGNPEDLTIDTYDQSFGLLALAWDFRVRGAADSRDAARQAYAALAEFAASSGGGYREQRPGGKPAQATAFSGLRRQDPHMHLFEACVAWHACDPSGPWREGAREILRLLREKFRRPDGSLAAYFNDDLEPAPGGAGKIRIVGDHYEWAWLLGQYAKICGDNSVEKDAAGLYAFAEKHGKDKDGLVFSSVDPGGEVLDRNKLLWMQTEMLKAQLAMYEWTHDAAFREAAEKTILLISENYMYTPELFCNKLDADGKPDASPTFTRLLYHFFVAVSEAARVLA